MQKANDSTNGGSNAVLPALFRQQNQRLSFSHKEQSNGSDFCSRYYPSLFHPKESLLNSKSVSLTPSPSSCDEEIANAVENRQYLTHLTLQYQEVVEMYDLCFIRLQEATQEVEALRQENATLWLENRALIERVSLLSVSGKRSPPANGIVSSSASSSLPVINDFQRLRIGDYGRNGLVSVDVPATSPTSVLGFQENQFERRNVDRVSLPKSISIRSSGFQKENHQGTGENATSNRASRFRVASPVAIGSPSVYVPKGKKEEEELEFEVYKQGMFKTELCNKWQETGACPYGEHCQFAHGIEELRPVLRHPRYKTEVCRMVLAGDSCPYGHRCHFRHALTEQDRCVSQA